MPRRALRWFCDWQPSLRAGRQQPELPDHAAHCDTPPVGRVLDGFEIHAEVVRSRIAPCKATRGDVARHDHAAKPGAFETKTMWSYRAGVPPGPKQIELRQVALKQR